MTDRIIPTNLTPIECTIEITSRLMIEQDDVSYIADGVANGGTCYTFTASGGGNTGCAYVDPDFTAVAWGGDPQWFHTAHDEDIEDIAAALNGELDEL